MSITWRSMWNGTRPEEASSHSEMTVRKRTIEHAFGTLKLKFHDQSGEIPL